MVISGLGLMWKTGRWKYVVLRSVSVHSVEIYIKPNHAQSSNFLHIREWTRVLAASTLGSVRMSSKCSDGKSAYSSSPLSVNKWKGQKCLTSVSMSQLGLLCAVEM